VLNLHHRGEVIEREVGDGRKMGMKITYSREEQLLGTGGGVRTAVGLWKDEEILVVNGDNILDLNLEKLIQFHRAREAVATMAVKPRSGDSEYTPVYLNDSGLVESIGGDSDRPAHVFVGAQILTPRFIQRLPAGKPSCLINNGYRKAIKAGERVAAMITTGYWREISTIELYWQANLDFLKARSPAFFYRGREEFTRRGISAGKGCEFGPRTRFYYPVFLGNNCRVGANCTIGPAAQVGADSTVGDDCRLENVVIWPGIKVHRGTSLQNTILSPFGKIKIPTPKD